MVLVGLAVLVMKVALALHVVQPGWVVMLADLVVDPVQRVADLAAAGALVVTVAILAAGAVVAVVEAVTAVVVVIEAVLSVTSALKNNANPEAPLDTGMTK